MNWTTQQKIESIQKDIDRNNRILAAGGFTDADGDWIANTEAGVARKTAENERLNALIARLNAENN